MLRSVSSRSQTCAKYSRIQRQIFQNHSATASREIQGSVQIPRASFSVNHITPGSQNDDQILRQIFDCQGFWREYSRSSKSGTNHGLFQNRYLTEPRGFKEFTSSSLRKAEKVVTQVLAASTPEQYLNVVKDLDRLSDLLCRVIDLSDFVRATHPDLEIQKAATESYSTMLEYMNILNTTTGLAKQLDVAIEKASISGAWEEQEHTVAEILRRDFAKSAINLPKSERERFVSLCQQISEVGQEFVDHMGPAQRSLTFPSSRLKGMDPVLASQLTRWGQATILAVGGPATIALRSVHDEAIRKDLFIASRSSSKPNLERLRNLLQLRAELAKLSAFESYAHLTLDDKMAKSPRSVNRFLRALSHDNKTLVETELAQLVAAKKRLTNTADPNLQPWDKEYYMSHILSSMPSRSKNHDFLSSYFSLGRVMQGLSRLFTCLYGIRFVAHETLPGEIWDPDVRRLDVISETDGHVAVLYCDLFSRPGKSPNPAHFTLRCSRLIRHKEIEEAALSPNPLFENPAQAVNDGMAISTVSHGIMQLPTIALICDFVPNTTNRPSLLSFSELTTLFHEMGHAIHSILGRTDFHNVAGTRCATDFSELPSVLMEYFVANANVLNLFAGHYETGEKLNLAMVQKQLDLEKRFMGCDTENQILMSLLDQAYHSHLPLEANFDTTKIYHEIQQQNGLLPPDPAETSWEGFFGHLFGYGGSYYSYLFDRVLAKKIWSTVFGDGEGAVARNNGERLKNEVLQWGGARDPWKSLSIVLRDERLASGGEKAMGLVGSWGKGCRI